MSVRYRWLALIILGLSMTVRAAGPLDPNGVPSGNIDPTALAVPTTVDPMQQAATSSAITASHGAISNVSHARTQPSLSPTSATSAASTHAPLPESEFQKLVAQSLGKPLPLFGYDLFSSPTTFAPVDQAPVTPDYIIGPGDEILIHAWGQIDIDYTATVDRLGNIYLPKVGTLQVAGLKYQDLQNNLHQAIAKNFNNFELQVNLGQLRSIQIFVVGQAQRPGSYIVSSLSTLINALFAVGGPNNAGSLRHIQLKRDGKLLTELDLYDFLLRGDKSHDVKLQSGDVILFPAVGHQAAISGSVRLPAIYEVNDGSDLAQLIALAGGLTATASEQKVNVERIHGHDKRTVAQVALDASGYALPLMDGDLVRILPITPQFDNAVTLRGNVAYPLRNPWHPGMTLTDLIPNKEALISREYWLKKNLTNQEVGENESRGAVRAGAVKKNLSDQQVASEVKLSANDIDWDYAVIERQSRQDLSSTLIPFNLGRLVLDHDMSQNVALQPGDVVTIFSQKDINVPQGKKTRFVRVDGEVVHAGVYRVEEGETLRHLVVRIGGVTSQAYLFGSELTRESTRALQQKQLNQILDRMEIDLNNSAGALAQGALDQKGLDAAKAQMEGQRQKLAKMRQTQVSGRIILDVPENDNHPEALPELPLEDGDHLYVPPVPSTVGVYGDVYAENSAFMFDAHKHVGEYIDMAGGPTRDADAGRMFLIRANGAIISRQNTGGLFARNFSHLDMMPGDAVVVPEEPDKTPVLKSFLDYATIFMNMGVGLATLKFMGII